ncbi:hypothetical protein DBR43_27790 [Pedobacter sp. KBW06]|nr:hypothetical protein DBR43_27790 [Pedobacter sp. KBW06]
MAQKAYAICRTVLHYPSGYRR